MPGTIATAARRRTPVFLMEIDAGETLRLATHNVCFDDRRFWGGLLEVGDVGASFDWTNLNYSENAVSIVAANVRDRNGLRLSDRETYRILDRAETRLYAWFDNGGVLDWDAVASRGLICRGVFRKDMHAPNGHTIDFAIEPYAGEVWDTIPGESINVETWPDLRTDGSGGSAEGVAYPLVFGTHAGGLGMYCIDTSNYKYLVAGHPMKSVDTVYDKDGSSIGSGWSASVTVDGRGNICQIVTFTSDQSANEPLTAGGDGVEDTGGIYTGTAGALITHPADIFAYIVAAHSTLGAAWLDVGSVKTVKSMFPGFALAATCTTETDAGSWLDRLLYQCGMARTDRIGGRHGLVALDMDRTACATLFTERATVGAMSVSKTPWDLVTNDVSIDYKYRSYGQTYAGNLRRDRTNHAACRSSWMEYGDTGKKSLQFPDASDESTALWMLNRRLGFFSHRHDLVAGVDVPYAIGWDWRRGDCLSLTMPAGQSRDGDGWSDERCLIVDKQYFSDRIRLGLVRCRNNMDYGGYSIEVAASGGTGDGWLGDGWLDEGWV